MVDESGNTAKTTSAGYRTCLLMALIIFAVALAVRLIYIYDSSDSPCFYAPVVDAASYNKLARNLAESAALDTEFFWHPFFYTLYLTVVYTFTGPSILLAKVSQAILGAISCTLTYLLGRRIFGQRTGILAGLIIAFYGPVVFFKAELLSAGWVIFWSAALPSLLIWASQKKTMLPALLFGLCGAMAIMTHPTFLLFFTVSALWLSVHSFRSGPGWGKLIRTFFGVLAGFLLVSWPVATIVQSVTGSYSIFPNSGGINLYIGNNPNYTETITARPGLAWEKLIQKPYEEGAKTRRDAERFFYRRTLNYIKAQPASFLKGLVHKAGEFISSREIPRNMDIYVLRKFSRLLSLMVWKIDGFGFPLGVILPLAVLGLISSRRQIPVPIFLFLILYPLSIILVFVSARYRVAIIPILSILSAAGIFGLIEIVKVKNPRKLAALFVFGLAIILLASVPGPFVEENINYEAELYYFVGGYWDNQSQFDKAIENYTKAIELKNDYAEAHDNLGLILLNRGQIEQAIDHFNESIYYEPENPRAEDHLQKAVHELNKKRLQ